VQVSTQAERRFILGLQGLWPGRRWKGPQGIRDAVRECNRVRVDPLDVVGRCQDLILASRVVDYRVGDLDQLLYQQRGAFEFGGTVAAFSKEKMPLHYSWVHHEGLPMRWERWEQKNQPVLRRVLREIDRNGPISSADLAGTTPVDDYRSSRLEGVALYVLWRRLRVLIHHREGNRKFYDRSERLFGPPPSLLGKDETLNEMAFQSLAWRGLAGRPEIAYLRTNEDGRGRSKFTKRALRQRLIDDGRLQLVSTEREEERSVVPTLWMSLLETVAAGDVPRSWRPISDDVEAIFVAPLDILIGAGREKRLFDFDYLWEVYKPACQRRWGYFVLPVLIGDQLVGRIEPVRDRSTGALRVAKAWWEKGVDLNAIPEPLARGLDRFAKYLGDGEILLGDVGPAHFRTSLRRELRRLAN
jgi:uncharacterized protein